jgi:hypothetical protein
MDLLNIDLLSFLNAFPTVDGNVPVRRRTTSVTRVTLWKLKNTKKIHKAKLKPQDSTTFGIRQKRVFLSN